MIAKVRELIRRSAYKRSLIEWEAAAQAAHELDLPRLRQLRSQARQLRNRLDQVAHIAEGRLALPRIGSDAIRRPSQTDWAYRPEIWSGPIAPTGMSSVESRTQIGNDAILYHDCTISELTYRQIRNGRDGDLSPFSLRLDVFRFDGSFLSLVLYLPEEATHGLRRNHILRLDAEVELEKPLEIFARLNIKSGPNVEQMVRELPLGGDEVMVEFDLDQTKMSENRLERIWLDLIFDGPEMNEINLRDITLTRRPRAEF